MKGLTYRLFSYKQKQFFEAKREIYYDQFSKIALKSLAHAIWKQCIFQAGYELPKNSSLRPCLLFKATKAVEYIHAPQSVVV